MTALLDAQLRREAAASVALDKGDGQTQTLEGWSARPPVLEKTRKITIERRATAPSVPDPDEKQEIVIEPDLPVTEPGVSPAGPPPPEEELAPDDAEMVAFLNLSPAEQAEAEYYAAVAAMDPAETRWKAGNRAPRLQVGAYTLKPGEIVPGADSWSRRDAWERTGRIERA